MTTRRKFLGQAAAAIAAPTIVPSTVFGENAPSNRVAMGFVGLGNRGIGVMEAFLNHNDVQGVAICDVAKKHRRDLGEGKFSRPYGTVAGKEAMEKIYRKRQPSGEWKGCDIHHDFRELCQREDIDAIQVATPDHWHALITLEALRNGKDVYCEKPMTHLFAEGLAVHREVAEREAVFQVGSQQRSGKEFQQAVEVVRNGLIGKVTRVEVGLPAGYHDTPQGDPAVKDPPAGLDYDFYCGPMEKIPYRECTTHWHWRWHLNFGGGQLMDWIGHHNDIAHWGLGFENSGPVSVEAKNWAYPETEVYDSPIHYDVHSLYQGGDGEVEVVISSRNEMGVKWIGEDGWVHATRGKMTASKPDWAEEGFDAGPWKTYKVPGHQRNFIDCVHSREECIAPAENGHRSITPGHIAYVSQALGRKIKWDPEKEQVVGDDSAQEKLMALPYRGDWSIG